MRIVLQRTLEASVSVEGEVIGTIRFGYLLLVGIEKGDTDQEARWLAEKIVHLRLFPNEHGKINDRTILQAGGEMLVVSQFTLLGSLKGGNRPDYTAAAAPDDAAALINFFAEQLGKAGVAIVERGRFGAHMTVRLVNDGPVTLLLERRAAYHDSLHGA